jgi:SAM-dependent methyltransferase
MLEAARELAERDGVTLEFRVARAEQTGLPAVSVDVVSAGQCWHWFDRPRAAKEVVRILKPEGWLVIAHFDWIPLSGNVVRATEKLIERHNPEWKLGAGFRQLESFSYDVDVPYTPEAWRGRIRASAGVGGSMAPHQVEEFDRALEQLLASRFAADRLAVPHRVFAIVARPPGRES